MNQIAEDVKPRKDNPLKYILIAGGAAAIGIAISIFILSTMYVGEPPGCSIPTGSWCEPEIVGPTEVHVAFGDFTLLTNPTDLEIVLVRDNDESGRYTFQSTQSDDLLLVSGQNVGTLYYNDFANNDKINRGDEMQMTDLLPDSDYAIMMYWVVNGDLLAETSFSTPDG